MPAVLTTAVLLSFTPLAAQQQEQKRLSLEPYGFVKGDMYYASGDGALSWDTRALTSVTTASDTGGEGISFTAQHTRLGLDGSLALERFDLGARVETDFWVVQSDANARLRMRLAYGWVKPERVEGLDIRFGQQWDVFSPLNPVTNNTNANLWYAGNYGFRRTQVQLRYSLPIWILQVGAQASIGEPTKEDFLRVITGGATLGEDNRSGQPLYQARINAVLPLGIDVGFAGVYGLYGPDERTSTWGISLDAYVPALQFVTFMGEFAYGSNLNNANLFTVGGSGGPGDGAVTTVGLWLNAVSKLFTFLQVTAGYGMEDVRRRVNDSPESNYTFYGNAMFLLGDHLSFTLEAQRLITPYPGNTAVVNVLDVAGKVTF
jgi:hypothetical protein